MIAGLLNSFTMNLEHARRLLDDLDDEQMTLRPAEGVNHPAWIAGHIALSFQMIGGELGLRPWLPAEWTELFETGSTPVTQRTVYPDKARLLAALDEGRERLSSALANMTDADLDGPLPDEKCRHVFPMIGSAVLHILTVHAATHLGQLSAWRRMMGLPRVADPL